jgi:multidrug resistance efflux pump
MPVPFPRCTQALASERDGRSALTLVFAAAVFVSGVAWSILARVTVFETTESARVEAVPGAHVVQAQVSGRVVKTQLMLGKQVQAGDVLIELDATREALELDEGKAKVKGLADELAALDAERDATARSVNALRNELPSVLREADLRKRESEVTALLAEGENARIVRLFQTGAVSEQEAARAHASALERRTAAQVSDAAVSKLGAERSRLLSDRLANTAALERERARITGELDTSRARALVLERVIAQRTIKAPISGRLAQIYDLQIGAYLDEGSRVAAIVPPGDLRVVANFPAASALGRIHTGQTAWLRLNGFPWTEYGKPEARVQRVGSEALEGTLRVELSVPTPPVYLSHGLATSVEVAVERVSPASLLLRVAARKLTGVVHAAVPAHETPE